MIWLGTAALAAVLTVGVWGANTQASHDPHHLKVESRFEHVPIDSGKAGPEDAHGAPMTDGRGHRWGGWLGLSVLGLYVLGLAGAGRAIRVVGGIAGWLANAWDSVVALGEWLWEEWLPARVAAAWDRASAWLRTVILMGRDFIAGAAIEYADAVGLGLLRPSLRRWGIDPDLGAPPAYEAGRLVGGLGAAVQGVMEIIAGIGMMVGGGGGGALLALPTGGTIAIPAAAVIGAGMAVAGHGAGTATKGLFGAGDALAQIVGKWREYLVSDRLLTEEEIRQLLGPNASEENVRRFMRFQAYAVEIMGKNLDKGRITRLLEKHGGLGAVLREWIAEIGPERMATLLERYADRPHVLEAITDTATILDRYTGRRQTLGAITEHRLAMKLAEQKDLLWMKVVPHTNHRGADIYFAERIMVDGAPVFRAGIADAKGSLSGANIQGSSAFSSPRIELTIEQLKIELNTAELKRQITPEQYKVFEAAANNPDIIIGVGGTASISDNAVEMIRRTLTEKRIQSAVEVILLDN